MKPSRRLRRDTFVNVISVALRVVALMWVIRLASGRFTAVALGLFLLSRRISSTLACLAQLGISQALLRYVGQYTDEPAAKRVFVTIAIVVWMGVAACGLAVALLFAEPLARWLFPGIPGSVPLAQWTVVLLVATVASFLPYSVLLAERRVLAANVVELMNASGFLLVAILWYGAGATPVKVISAHAMAMMVMSLAALGWYAMALPGAAAMSPIGWRDAVTTTARFGLPRGGSAFLDMLVLLVGPWMLRDRVEQAGYLIIALTLVRMLQTAVAPLSQMGAIVVARLSGPKSDERMREGVRLLAAGALYATTLSLALGLPWLDGLLGRWLAAPEVAVGVARYARILAWGVVPYVVFQSLKGVVEMRWVQPRNLYSLLAAVGIQVGLTVGLSTVMDLGSAAAIGIAVSFAVLGVLTVTWLRGYLSPIGDFAVLRLTVVGLALALGNAFMAAGGRMYQVIGAAGWSIAIVSAFLFLFPSPLLRSMRTFLLAEE